MDRHRPCAASDYTPGLVMMWAEYLDYGIHIQDNTLFMRTRDEQATGRISYALPMGAMPLARSLDLLKRHCVDQKHELVLSPVPACALPQLQQLAQCEITPMVGWSDYVYDIQALATLTGKKLNKKRNHVNRFAADNPGYKLIPLNADNAPQVINFYQRQPLDPDMDAMGRYERWRVLDMLSRLGDYPMLECAALHAPGRGVVAFTMGEVAGDTLVTHVEKMAHDVPGSGETVNKLYAQYMLDRHPQLRWVNREEDCGNPGLRHAKQSYHPAFMVDKFSVRILA